MSTSTLEQIDWATCMDDEPMCEWPHANCDASAANLLRFACGCRFLWCAGHTKRITSYLAAWVRGPFHCQHCGTKGMTGKTVSDLVTVIPL